jgi:cytochrome c556
MQIERGGARVKHLPFAVLVLGFAASFVGCASQPPPTPPQQDQLARAISPPEKALEPAQPLPGAARAVLKSRMANHVRDMTDLVSAIMVLDYPTIANRAKAVASDANLARPLGGDATELNALLPDRFFEYQDELRKNARALAAAAERMDALEVAEAYGHVSESCVRCHAVYRGGR